MAHQVHNRAIVSQAWNAGKAGIGGAGVHVEIIQTASLILAAGIAKVAVWTAQQSAIEILAAQSNADAVPL
jgi:hypothetical protein